ncbi:MAG TPA: winged helix-turn-helix domain-containing protein [Vicinamibacterales bacterium]|nr:winged helix-turn-helix domain-containing protein [Vicinamibacterales bacterium]
MSPADRVRFGEFEADLRTGELWRAGTIVRIQDLPFRLLGALLERPGELVTRAELGQRLWGGDTFVDFEAGLNTAVAKLREALQDDDAQIVQTVPKRGYRMAAAVVDAAVPAIVPQEGRPSRRGFAVAALAAIPVLALASFFFFSRPLPVRVAVVLFDNETGREEFDRLAQTLTDSVVLKLGGDSRLAVIGNAAILRTDRPFRDLQAIRAAVGADLIIIGQVQEKAAGYRVMTHLIRAKDDAHVWVKETLFTSGAEPALERDVIEPLADAVAKAKVL